MSSASYRSLSAASTPVPLLRRVPPTPVHCFFLPWQYYYSCALSLPFCPALCSCPPPRKTAYSLPRTPPRAPAPHSATLSTEHALMAVATTPFNPAELALFRLVYPSRAGTEIESAELPYPVGRPSKTGKWATRARSRRRRRRTERQKMDREQRRRQKHMGRGHQPNLRTDPLSPRDSESTGTAGGASGAGCSSGYHPRHETDLEHEAAAGTAAGVRPPRPAGGAR